MGKTLWKVDFGFLVLLAFLLAEETAFWGIHLLLPIFLHEAAHLIGLLFFGKKPRKIRFSLVGIGVEGGREQLTRKQEIWVLFLGPGVNLVCFLLLALFLGKKNPSLAASLAAPHLILGLWNLLPMRITDGGRLLELILVRFFSYDTLRRFFFWLSFFLLLFLLALAFLLLFQGQPSLTLFLSVGYLTAQLFLL